MKGVICLNEMYKIMILKYCTLITKVLFVNTSLSWTPWTLQNGSFLANPMLKGFVAKLKNRVKKTQKCKNDKKDKKSLFESSKMTIFGHPPGDVQARIWVRSKKGSKKWSKNDHF